MKATTKNTIEIAHALGRRGFTLASVEVHTPDGRTWEVASVPAGRGRHPDGHWGPRTGAAGGFRLFEIDRDGRRGPDEHDAVDGDIWTASDLLDYLAAVGEPKAPPSSPRPSDLTT